MFPRNDPHLSYKNLQCFQGITYETSGEDRTRSRAERAVKFEQNIEGSMQTGTDTIPLPGCDAHLPHVQVAVSGSQLSRFLGSPGHSYSPMVGVDGAG